MSTPEIWLRQGESLVAANAYGSAEFAQGLALLQKAADSNLLEAQVILGHVYAQVQLLPDSAARAVACYRRAAGQGHPVAQDRLADLYMIGRGVAQDDTQAFDWYRRTAEQAYPVAQCSLAYMLGEGIGCTADDAEATNWYLRAAAQGEPRAYFNLALRYRDGLGAPLDAALAWACMANAAALQYPGADAGQSMLQSRLAPAERDRARQLAASLRANFDTLQATLKAAPQLLESAETYRETVERNFGALSITALSPDAERRLGVGHRRTADSRHQPGPRREICAAPRIFTVDEFVSPGEGAHLMTLAAINLQPAQADTRDRLSQEHSAFSGEAATFHTALCDPVVRNLERRIGAAFALPPSHVEPVSVLRYQGGDLYQAHVDYFDAARLARNREIGDLAGQRVASFLVYLRAPEAGGETHYLKIDRKIAGRERMALCHFNCDARGEPDPMTLHAGAPVTKGEKWLARTTLREKSFY
jgi:prolyl 4-hydroxylase